MIWMCKEVNNYKMAHNNDFSNYFNLKEIDNDAEQLLHDFYKNAEYKLEEYEGKETPIIKIAKIMGFKVFTAKFDERTLSGTIGVSEQLMKTYGSNKVIILNNEDTDKHILFTLAHEIAHYIYDYDPNTVGYSNTYKPKKETDIAIIPCGYMDGINEAKTNKEVRANRFAAAFMMPKKAFTIKYYELQDITKLSDYFNIPETAVKLRIQELEL